MKVGDTYKVTGLIPSIDGFYVKSPKYSVKATFYIDNKINQLCKYRLVSREFKLKRILK